MARELWGVEWDESAQRLYALARQESFAIGDEYIGTQHLLLGAVAVTPVEEHGFAALCRDSVLSAIVEVIGVRDPDTLLLSPGGQTPRAKLTLMRAMERATADGRVVSRRDIWHGLLADPDSECYRVLRHLGVNGEQLRRALA
jgi:hypothetical protein